MGRKNRRKISEYKRPLGFNPKRYIGSSTHIYTTHNTTPTVQSASEGSVQRSPHRGDVWFAKLFSYPGTSVQGGYRPVLVISNDTGNVNAETINVLPMTSRLKKPNLPCHTLLESGFVADTRQRLDDSMLLAEQIATIGKSQLRRYAGRVEDTELLAQISHAISAQLGLE